MRWRWWWEMSGSGSSFKAMLKPGNLYCVEHPPVEEPYKAWSNHQEIGLLTPTAWVLFPALPALGRVTREDDSPCVSLSLPFCISMLEDSLQEAFNSGTGSQGRLSKDSIVINFYLLLKTSSCLLIILVRISMLWV